MTLEATLSAPNGALVVLESSGAVSLFEEEIADAKRYAEADKAEATRSAYRSDFAIFTAWCAKRSLPALPASAAAVATFIASEASNGVRPSTIGRRLAAIRYAHKLAAHEPPTGAESVRAVMSGIRRTVGTKPLKKDPATSDKLLAMVALAPPGLAGLRDRALLLLGFAGAFRRSELVALTVEDLKECEGGFKVSIGKSKTDQEGAGAVVGILRGSVACPVEAVKAWLIAAGITEGPVFRKVNRGGNVEESGLTPWTVAHIVKRYAVKVGLKPEHFAGHSLRSGFITSASQRGANIFRMMDVSRHKSVDTLRGYVREGEIFRDHAGRDCFKGRL